MKAKKLAEEQEEPRYGTLADVEPEKIEWFWRPFIAYGMLTILEGDPGLGKSMVTMYLAAQVSVGGLLPNGDKLRRGRALIINAEDDPAYTLRPRIDALGGDPSRIRFMSIFSVLDDEGFAALRKEIESNPPQLMCWIQSFPTCRAT